MKKSLKKNQIIITALALMIAVAGYVSYTKSNVDNSAAKEASADLTQDSYEVSDDAILEGDIYTATEEVGLDTASAAQGTEVALNDDGTQSAAAENPGEAVLTSSAVSNVDFAAEMKLAREQVRAKNKETLLEIVNNTNLTDEQKQTAVDQMIGLTDVAEREAAAEMLLEAKGFTDVVVSITDSAADVVLNMGDVTDAKRAQIEDIVKRKTNVSAENIVITPIETKAGTSAGATESPQSAAQNTESAQTAGSTENSGSTETAGGADTAGSAETMADE